MEASLVAVLQWQKPIKSTVALVSLNVIYWLLLGQRPLFVFFLCLLLAVLRSSWKKIRGVVLVDPPDHESWTPLETYSLRQNVVEFSERLITQYFLLRSRSHVTFSIISCCFFLGIGKLGTYIHLRTLVFLIANGAFCVVPLYKMLHTPKEQVDELVPDSDPEHDLWSPTQLPSEPEDEVRDSLAPFVVHQQMRSHDEESDDEFHFDTKHFDSSRSSTSSTTSTSFELINL